MIRGQMGSLLGIQLIVRDPIEVRTRIPWKKRLFSWPWKPWISHTISYKDIIPDGQVIQTPGVWYMNTKTHTILKNHIDKNNPDIAKYFNPPNFTINGRMS